MSAMPAVALICGSRTRPAAPQGASHGAQQGAQRGAPEGVSAAADQRAACGGRSRRGRTAGDGDVAACGWRRAGNEPWPVTARGAAEPRAGGGPPGPEPVVSGGERGSGSGHPRRHPADHRPQLAERRYRWPRASKFWVRAAQFPAVRGNPARSAPAAPRRRDTPGGACRSAVAARVFRIRRSRPLASGRLVVYGNHNI